MRPIELERDKWVTVKEAASLRQRSEKAVRAWIASGAVRIWREPGGRLLVYRPDVVPPMDPPARIR